MGVGMSATRRVVAALALVAAGLLAWPLASGAAGQVSVFSVLPGAVAQGASVQTTIAGAGFSPGAVSVSVAGTGVTVSGVTVRSASTLTATLSATATAALGSRELTVTVGSNAGTLASAVSVEADPTVTAVAPARIAATGRRQWVELVGTNFEPGMRVSIEGVTTGPSPARLDGPTTAFLQVLVPTTTPLGPHATTVANPDGGTAAAPGGVTVVAIPQASTLATTPLTEDETTVVTLPGYGFVANASARVLGGGVLATVLSSTAHAIEILLHVPRATPTIGHRTLVVHDGGTLLTRVPVHIAYYPVLAKWAVGDGASGWTTSLARPLLPTVPMLGFAGGGVVTGTHLDASHHLVVTFAVGRDAATGWRTMTINDGTASWVIARGLRVRYPPVITSFPSLKPGTVDRTVLVKGRHFEVCPGTEPTVTISGTGVTVNSVSTALGFLMYVDVSVAPTAAIGPRSVTMTNCDSGGTATEVGVPKVTS